MTLLIIAFTASTAFTITTVIGTERYGFGRHAWDIPPSYLPEVIKLVWIAQAVFLICGCALKVSVLLFYRRLTGKVSPVWKWAIVAAIIFTVIWSAAFLLALIFNCQPTKGYWLSFDQDWRGDVKCGDARAVNLLAGVLAGVSDFYTVAIPLLLTRQVKIVERQRFALNLLFLIGLIATACSGVRAYWLWQAGLATRDSMEAVRQAGVWSQAELSLGMICASAPTLRVFFRRYLSSPISHLGTKIKSSGGSERFTTTNRSDRLSSMGKCESQEQMVDQATVEMDTMRAPDSVLVTHTISTKEEWARASPGPGRVVDERWLPEPSIGTAR